MTQVRPSCSRCGSLFGILSVTWTVGHRTIVVHLCESCDEDERERLARNWSAAEEGRP